MISLTINWGGALTLVGFSFSMVFLLLIFIVFALNIFGKIFTSLEKRSQQRAEQEVLNVAGPLAEEGESPDTFGPVSGEVFAAIAMALHHIDEDAHDRESNIITITSVSKRYAPWSSKIYGLNVFPK